MKKSIVILSIFMVILLMGCTTNTSQNETSTTSNSRYKVDLPVSAGDGSNVDFELSLKQSNYKETVQVYKFEKLVVNEEYIKDISARFGLKEFADEEIGEGPDNFLVQDRANHIGLEIYKQTGGIFYHNSGVLDLDSPKLPSEDEAIRIAKDFLVKNDLLPAGPYTNNVIVGQTGGAHGLPQDLSVSFIRQIDGFLFCPNRFDVRVGNDGKIVEVYINPAKYSPYDEVHLKTAEQAFQELKSGKHFTAGVDTKKVIIESAQIKYYLAPLRTGQEYIVPIYEFTGKAFNASGKELKRFDISGNELQAEFTGWVEAIQ